MKSSSVSPTVAAVLILLLLVVLGGIGYRMLSSKKQESTDLPARADMSKFDADRFRADFQKAQEQRKGSSQSQ